MSSLSSSGLIIVVALGVAVVAFVVFGATVALRSGERHRFVGSAFDHEPDDWDSIPPTDWGQTGSPEGSEKPL